MQRIKLFIPLIIFAVLAIVFYIMLSKDYNPQDLPSALVGKSVPAFDLEVLNIGAPLSTQRVSEQSMPKTPYLLNVWATWCIACRVEHPFLNQLKAQGINIVGLDYKDDKAKAIDWLKKLHNPYSVVVFDKDGKLGLDLGVYGAPETFLVDSQGRIHYKHVGVIEEKVWQNTLKPVFDGLK